jgi:hypothetical protein
MMVYSHSPFSRHTSYLFISGILLFTVIFPLTGFCDREPALRDPRFPIVERATYKINQKGKVHFSIHRITHETRNGQAVYIISTDTQEVIIRANNLTPISIKQSDKNTGELEFAIEYYKQGDDYRARFINPGPERNEVKEVSEDSYDVNMILEAMRGYPLQEKEVKFTLVTADHVVGVYAKKKDDEKITIPLGTFDCHVIETGVSGLKGRIIRTKFYFWVEKAHPHRVIQQKNSDEDMIVTLDQYEVLPETAPPKEK